jgi:Na+/melibiose symporter-like transporter
LYFYHFTLFEIFLFAFIFAIDSGLSRSLIWIHLTRKLGVALGGAFSGVILGATGYVANAAQSVEAWQGISVTIVPIIAYVLV